VEKNSQKHKPKRLLIKLNIFCKFSLVKKEQKSKARVGFFQVELIENFCGKSIIRGKTYQYHNWAVRILVR
jgi:hypothetical protein